MVAANARTSITFALSPYQAHNAPEGREILTGLGPESLGSFLLMDRAYQGNGTRRLALDLGLPLVVPPLNSGADPWEYDREMYKRRNETERLVRRMKGFRRIFSDFEKLDILFIGLILSTLTVDALFLCGHSLSEIFARKREQVANVTTPCTTPNGRSCSSSTTTLMCSNCCCSGVASAPGGLTAKRARFLSRRTREYDHTPAFTRYAVELLGHDPDAYYMIGVEHRIPEPTPEAKAKCVESLLDAGFSEDAVETAIATLGVPPDGHHPPKRRR